MRELFYYEHFNITLHPITLSFDKKDFEKAFRLYFNTKALIPMKVGIIVTFILFTFYAMMDHIVFPDIEQKILLLRALEGVFLLSLFFLLHYKKDHIIQKLHMYSSVLMLFTGGVLLKISSFSPDNNLIYVLYEAGLTLFFTAIFTLFGNRFIFALLAAIVMDIGIGIIHVKQLELMPLLLLQALFLSMIILAGFNAYLTEYNQRMLFLENLYAQEMEEQVQAQMEELKKLSVTDKLTGLYNRVKLEKELLRLMSEFQRYKTPCSVILIDIDHFKAINDKYGHLEGDNVLVKVAKILQNNTRKTDIVGRWGGEEFLILASNTTLDHAAVLAEKLRHTIEEASFGAVGHKTISVGVSTFQETLTTTEIIDKADQALYKAKNSGRNKVVLNEYDIDRFSTAPA